MDGKFLLLHRISKRFEGVQALQDISLSLDTGKTYGLVGENGSGKSTLIKIIAGVLAPDSGEMAFGGRVYKRLHPIESIREGIQVIYQDFSLFPNLTVGENIALNRQISSKRFWVNWHEVGEIAAGALGRINVQLELDAPAGCLPAADRQLIAIARSLLQNARLIVMDEPTAALTQKEVKSLFAVIESLKKKGISILFVSHKLDEVLEIADRIIVLRNGVKVEDQEAAGVDRTSLVQSMTGRSIEPETSLFHTVPASATVLLKVEKLSCARFFHDISFELRAGEILGITGLLGSGRTALALSLFGVLPAEAGTVSVERETVKLSSITDALRNGIAYVPEDRLKEGLFLTQSIGKNIVVRIIESLRGKTRLLNKPAAQARIDEWVARMKIRTPSAGLPVSSLSGGNQQRVVLAKWLASHPRILILNGPTVGIDVGSKTEIHEIIRDLAQRGEAILVISDDIPELMQVCHRILLMKKGRIAEAFERQDITEARLSALLISA
jgi:simple sugar transport system ATP-binding protein